MSPLAIAMMATICGFVWGGFLTLLVRALRREGSKARAGGAGARTGG